MDRYSRSDLARLAPDPHGPILLDLGCGTRKRAGHIGADLRKLAGVDLVCNLEEALPFEDSSIDGIYSNFIFEHVSETVRLFEELHRVCISNASIEFRVPSYQSITQYKDPTHKSIIVPEMFSYFSGNKWYGSDYGFKARFEVLDVDYEYLPPFSAMAGKKLFFLWPITYPFLRVARRFLWNVVHSTTIKLRVVK